MLFLKQQIKLHLQEHTLQELHFFKPGMAQIGSSKNRNGFQKQQPSLRAAGNAAARQEF